MYDIYKNFSWSLYAVLAYVSSSVQAHRNMLCFEALRETRNVTVTIFAYNNALVQAAALSLFTKPNPVNQSSLFFDS